MSWSYALREASAGARVDVSLSGSSAFLEGRKLSEECDVLVTTVPRALELLATPTFRASSLVLLVADRVESLLRTDRFRSLLCDLRSRVPPRLQVLGFGASAGEAATGARDDGASAAELDCLRSVARGLEVLTVARSESMARTDCS